MANPHRGAVALEAGEKVYSLRFTTNSICELEDHFGGKGISQIVVEMQGQPSMKLVRAMIWGALIDGHPNLTMKEAGTILDEVGIETITEKLGEALKRYFPDAKEGEANPPKAKAG